MTTRNPAASVRARLLNKARSDGVDFQSLLTRYGLERMLYRLSVSRERDNFLLKGALLTGSGLRPIGWSGFGLHVSLPSEPSSRREINLTCRSLNGVPAQRRQKRALSKTASTVVCALSKARANVARNHDN